MQQNITMEPWYRHSVLYHIYPLSFADSNDDGFGDLRGIISHLNYLQDGTAESLGVQAVWLSPIYASPMKDWGYDITDHCAIDPRFGTMDDFDELVSKAHGLGMKLLMDFVPNHTSTLHDWFVASRLDKQNSHRDWYIWADPAPDGGPPNNWLSYFGGPAWTLDEATGQYYMHSFLPEQADLNWRNPQVRDGMMAVLRFWLAKGVDGFRTDAVYGIIKDDKLRDDPINPNYREGITDPAERNSRVHSAGQSALPELIDDFCDVLAEKADTFLLSEAYLNIPGLHQLYAACVKHPIHAPFNFNLMGLTWGASYFRNFIDDYEASLGPNDWPNYVLGNHDRHRLVTRLGPARARLLAMLQLTMRGLPVIYYGEELGMSDVNIATKNIRDPWELRVPGMNLGRDGARTPIAWSEGGTTATAPWLPVGEANMRGNVLAQERDPESMLNFYRHMIALRSQSPALSVGDYRSMNLDHPYIYAYIRETELQRMVIVLNFDSNVVDYHFKAPLGTWIAGTHAVMGEDNSGESNHVVLKAYEGRVYELGMERTL